MHRIGAGSARGPSRSVPLPDTTCPPPSGPRRPDGHRTGTSSHLGSRRGRTTGDRRGRGGYGPSSEGGPGGSRPDVGGTLPGRRRLASPKNPHRGRTGTAALWEGPSSDAEPASEKVAARACPETVF